MCWPYMGPGRVDKNGPGAPFNKKTMDLRVDFRDFLATAMFSRFGGRFLELVLESVLAPVWGSFWNRLVFVLGSFWVPSNFLKETKVVSARVSFGSIFGEPVRAMNGKRDLIV